MALALSALRILFGRYESLNPPLVCWVMPRGASLVSPLFQRHGCMTPSLAGG